MVIDYNPPFEHSANLFYSIEIIRDFELYDYGKADFENVFSS